MTRQPLLIDTFGPSELEANLSELETQAVDERTLKSIQQNYQASHQEEFLKLKTQAEALLLNLRKFAGQPSEDAEFTA
ncbi:MAG: hypothetical protein MH252_09910 [Thermosynechococcaceae cyanobacterium MS004]|nr:hypothetical protein [Thermosynechococcaceae cyanobacterium MS004]